MIDLNEKMQEIATMVGNVDRQALVLKVYEDEIERLNAQIQSERVTGHLLVEELIDQRDEARAWGIKQRDDLYEGDSDLCLASWEKQA